MNALKISTVLALLIFTEVGRADPLDNWTWRYPLPPRLPLLGVAYGNGQFVAVGERGVILTSADRMNWVQRFQNSEEPLPDTTPERLEAITYGNGQFVAVGRSYVSDIIVTSADGANWVRRFSGVSQGWLTGVAYGNDQFVAVGRGDTILTSTNGMNWIEHQAGIDEVLGVAYGNGQFVAVGSSAADGFATFATSPDGANWVQRVSGTTGALDSIAYGNGQFVAVGVGFPNGSAPRGLILTSADGVNWVLRQSGVTNWLTDICYGNGQFVAVGPSQTINGADVAGAILTSDDGVNWVQRWDQRVSGYPIPLEGIGYGNGHFVAVGDGGIMLTSADGVNWVEPPQIQPSRTNSDFPPWAPFFGEFSAITYGNGQFVAVGVRYADYSGVIVTSADGANWVQRESGTTNSLGGIAYGNGLFVAVGVGFRTPTGIHGGGNIVTSADGVNWVQRFSGGNLVGGIAYGNGLFVVPNLDGGTLTSTDGVTWVQHQSETTSYLSIITYGNGQFVGGLPYFDGSSIIVISTDGVNWVQRFSGLSAPFLGGIAYGSGQFVAVGPRDSSRNPNIHFTAASTDGVNWVLHQWRISGFDYGESALMNGVAYGNGQFVVVGGGEYGPPSIHTSSDGVNWVPRQSRSPYWILNGIVYGNGHFVAVGAGCMILQSGSIITLSMTPNIGTGLLSLSLEGPTGLNYTIQTSTDLISWRNLTNITSAQSTKVILDGLPATSERLFYRAYSQ